MKQPSVETKEETMTMKAYNSYSQCPKCKRPINCKEDGCQCNNFSNSPIMKPSVETAHPKVKVAGTVEKGDYTIMNEAPSVETKTRTELIEELSNSRFGELIQYYYGKIRDPHDVKRLYEITNKLEDMFAQALSTQQAQMRDNLLLYIADHQTDKDFASKLAEYVLNILEEK